MSQTTLSLSRILELVQEAGDLIMGFYCGEVQVTHKADNSPLTAADKASHELIDSRLRQLRTGWPVVSEESGSNPAGTVHDGSRFWLVDPLDGTKEFLKKSGEFTVNVALIERGKPVLGVVHAPALGLTYFAERGEGAFRQKRWGAPASIHTRAADSARLVVAVSRDHVGAALSKVLAKMPGAVLAKSGSSVKFCLVAEGEADLYLRDIPTMEWDTAAAQCIVEEAGGIVCDWSGNALAYGKPTLKNPSLITVGDPTLAWAWYLEGEGMRTWAPDV